MRKSRTRENRCRDIVKLATLVTLAILCCFWWVLARGHGSAGNAQAFAWSGWTGGLDDATYRALLRGSIAVVVISGIVVPIWRAWTDRSARLRLHGGNCALCGYPTATSWVCSECGLKLGGEWTSGSAALRAVRAIGLAVGSGVSVVCLLHQVIPLTYQTEIGITATPFFVGRTPPQETSGSADPRVSMLVESFARCELRLSESARMPHGSFDPDRAEGYIAVYAGSTVPGARLAGILSVPDSMRPETQADRDEIAAIAARFRRLEPRVAALTVEEVARRLADARRGYMFSVQALQRRREEQDRGVQASTASSVGGSATLVARSNTDWHFCATPKTTVSLLAACVGATALLAVAYIRLVRVAERFPWPDLDKTTPAVGPATPIPAGED